MYVTQRRTSDRQAKKLATIDSLRAQLASATAEYNAAKNRWTDQWEAAPNPFVAIADYRSPAARAKRKPFADAIVKAEQALAGVLPVRQGGLRDA